MGALLRTVSWADVPATDIRLLIFHDPRDGWGFSALERETGTRLTRQISAGDESEARARAEAWVADFASDVEFIEWRALRGTHKRDSSCNADI